MYINPNETTNKKIINSQFQSQNKGKEMPAILKGKIDQKQKSHASWIVMKIKNLMEKTVEDIRLLVIYFKGAQEAALQNSNIWYELYGNLG